MIAKSPNYIETDLEEHLSLCEALDRVLNKGVVICGDVTISVANVDLIYLSLRLLVTSVEAARRSAQKIGGAAFGVTDS